MSVLREFWRELNTPEDFATEPVRGATNQAGHIAIGAAVTGAICSLWVQVVGGVPTVWLIGAGVAVAYLVLVELHRQRWVGADTVVDTAFVAMGAALPPSLMSLTPSGRWVRTDDASAAYLWWLACAMAALAVYVYPRAKRAYGGGR